MTDSAKRTFGQQLTYLMFKALPFADAATKDLPLSRLLRLSLFQLSVGMATVLITGTLNRVMIVELGVPTWLVASMVALPFLIAPCRALIGYRSDTHKSYLGWRRVPFIWLGSMMMFGGFAIMPFALLLLQSQTTGPEWAGPVAAAVAFFFVGLGIHTSQTAGLALASDLSTEDKRPRVVALLYVMLLVGMMVSALALSGLLIDFTPKRLIQVVQGAAVIAIVLNVIALWKQEARQPHLTLPSEPRVPFRENWSKLNADPRTRRLLVSVGLGTLAFSMQDVLLEPYGAEILGLSVAGTTLLTALWAFGTLLGFALSGRWLSRGQDPSRTAANGAIVGVIAFSLVIFSTPMDSALLFRIGALLIGFGGGLFAVGTLTVAMELAKRSGSGLALGAWGGVQATALGLGLASGGFLRDWVSSLALNGQLGEVLASKATGYAAVYHLEIILFFAVLIAVGPLVGASDRLRMTGQFGVADMPG